MNISGWAKAGLAGAAVAGVYGAATSGDERSDQPGSAALKMGAAYGLAGGAFGAAVLPVAGAITDIGEEATNSVLGEVSKLKKPGGMKAALDKGADKILSGAGKIGAVGMGVASAPVGLTKAVYDNLLEEVGEDAGSLFNVKFNKMGKLLMAGAALMGAVSEGHDAYVESRKGMSSGKMLTPTPSFMEEQRQVQENRSIRMAEEYGAGGDLVFALNRNR